MEEAPPEPPSPACAASRSAGRSRPPARAAAPLRAATRSACAASSARAAPRSALCPRSHRLRSRAAPRPARRSCRQLLRLQRSRRQLRHPAAVAPPVAHVHLLDAAIRHSARSQSCRLGQRCCHRDRSCCRQSCRRRWSHRLAVAPPLVVLPPLVTVPPLAERPAVATTELELPSPPVAGEVNLCFPLLRCPYFPVARASASKGGSQDCDGPTELGCFSWCCLSVFLYSVALPGRRVYRDLKKVVVAQAIALPAARIAFARPFY